MEIFQCGIYVIIKLANIKGIITCCAIRFDKVTYEITYFIGGKQETIWVNQGEIEIEDSETLKIGFKK
jgi:hypothetical protein